jgi:recombination protein RecA
MDSEKTLQSLQRKFGEDSVYLATETPPVEVVSTGSYALDFATGIGGFPRGYVIEVFGKESTVKTSLSYYMIAAEQVRLALLKSPLGVAFINLEGRFSAEWAQELGVDLSKLIVANPKDGSEAADILYELVNSEAISLIIFDSVGAMLGKEEMEGTDRVGGQAKLVTGMVKRVMARAWHTRCTVIFLNQARADIGSPIAGAIESPGGHGLKHASAIRVQLRRKEGYRGIVDGQKKEIGFRVAATIKKNKAGGSPKRVAEFDFYTDDVEGHTFGIDHTEEIMSLTMRPGIDLIERSGAYYSHESFPEGRIHSREGVVNFLRENPKAVEVLRDQLVAKVRGDE